MTCSAAMRRTGPRRAGVRPIFRAISGFSFSAVRVTEIALVMKDPRPASIIRLLEDGSQVNTSGVIVSRYSARRNFRASTVPRESMTTRPSSSCSAPPKAQSSPRRLMFESTSWESPMPTGFWNFSRIFRPPTRRSSQLSGPSG